MMMISSWIEKTHNHDPGMGEMVLGSFFFIPFFIFYFSSFLFLVTGVGRLGRLTF